jgi:hypothetical protein
VSTRARILVAFAAAAWGGLLALAFMMRRGFYPDFLAFWYAARAFLHGLDPYAVTPSGAPYFVNDRFFYPFPSVLVVVPFAPFALPVAGALFFAVSSGLLAFAVSRDGYARLTLFLSFPYVMAASLGQWAPLIMAAVLLPGTGVSRGLQAEHRKSPSRWRVPHERRFTEGPRSSSRPSRSTFTGP